MARLVVDASVVVKWFLEESDSGPARHLRDDFASDDIDVDAPAVLPFEVLNAVRFGGRFSRRDLHRVVEMLAGFGIPLHHLEGGYAKVVADMTVDRDLTAYDASYLGLAKLLGVPLFTADQAMIDAASEGITVRHVRDYAGPLGI